MSLLLDRKPTIDTFGMDNAPMNTAASHGQVLSARMLLRSDADVNHSANHRIREWWNVTPLCSAVAGNGKGWLVPFLLAHDALSKRFHANMDTSFHKAVRLKQTHTVRALLESGAHIVSPTQDNKRPLEIALHLGDPDLIITLLQYGADVHKSCGMEPCALFYALWKGLGDIVQLLLEEYGVESDVEKVSPQGSTTLHCLSASLIEDLGLIDLLFGYVTKVDAEDKQGGLRTSIYSVITCQSNALIPSNLIQLGATGSLLLRLRAYASSVSIRWI
jgi:hypothetical protein